MRVSVASLAGVSCAVQAAESGSFTAAAQVLDLTPAAVSKNVAALETRLGVRLFNRTTRQLAPTAEGRRFLEQARAALALLQDAGEAAAPRSEPEGLVRVSCGSGFGRRYVLPLLPAFFERHPGVKVELGLSDRQVDLVREGYDVGIRGGAAPPQGMAARKLCDAPRVLVASPAYLQRRGTPAAWTDLQAGHALIAVRFESGQGTPWIFVQGRQRFTIEPAGALTLSSPEALVDAAEAGLGIAAVALHHAWDALQDGRLVTVLDAQFRSPGVEMAVFYPHRRGLAPRVRVFVDHLVAGLATHPALQPRTTAPRARRFT